MACVFDVDTTEIYGKNIECRIGRTLEQTAQSADEAISAIVLHRFQHKTACTASREWFHESCRQSPHKVSIQSALFHALSDAVDQHVHGTRSSEYANAHEDSNEIRDDLHSRGETFFSALDESIIDIDFLDDTGKDEGENDTK